MIKYYKTSSSKNIIFFISNSLGEFDFILPFIFSLKKKFPQLSNRIFIINNKITHQYLYNKELIKICHNLNVQIVAKNFIFSFFKKKIMEQSRLREFFFLVLNILNILRYYILSDIIYVENSGRALGIKLIYFFNLFIKKKIILYPHTGAQVNLNSQYKIFQKPQVFQDKPNLFINKSNIKYYKKKYFFLKKPIFIKHPINQEWINFIKTKSKKKKENYIVIYLNNFIDKKTYIYLLLITIKKLIKKNCRIKVYLKRHPRNYNYSLENKILNKILKKFKDKIKIKATSQSSFSLPIFSH